MICIAFLYNNGKYKNGGGIILAMDRQLHCNEKKKNALSKKNLSECMTDLLHSRCAVCYTRTAVTPCGRQEA